MHGPLRDWCQSKGERFVRVEGGPGECQWVIAWTSSEDLSKKRRRCLDAQTDYCVRLQEKRRMPM